MENFSKSIPKILMQNLFYPASFGTVLVSFVQKLSTDPIPHNYDYAIRLGFVLLLLLYFSQSYLMNEKRSSIYNWKTFFTDLIEVILIILAVVYLGFYTIDRDFRLFYIVLGVIPILHFLWSTFLFGEISRRLKILYGARFLLALIGAIVNNDFPFYHIIALLAMLGLTFWYISFKIVKQ